MMQVIYNTFVWMQLFNEINCRRIFNEINMFKGILNNWFFVGIWLFSAIVQVPCIARTRELASGIHSHSCIKCNLHFNFSGDKRAIRRRRVSHRAA